MNYCNQKVNNLNIIIKNQPKPIESEDYEFVEIENECDIEGNCCDMKCSICLESIESKVIVNCSHNEFCNDCLLKWIQINNNCPLCRKEIKLLEYIHNNTNSIKKVEVGLNMGVNKIVNFGERVIETGRVIRGVGVEFNNQMREIGGLGGWFRGNILGIWDERNLGV